MGSESVRLVDYYFPRPLGCQFGVEKKMGIGIISINTQK